MKSLVTTGTRRYGRWILGVLILLIACVGALILFWDKLPYQGFATRQVISALEGMGLQVNSLNVETLSQHEARISELNLGEEHRLKAENIVAQYDWRQVQHGKLHSLAIEGLSLTLAETPQGWVIGGVEPLLQSDSASTTPQSPVFDASMLRSMAPETVTVHHATLNAITKEMQVAAQLDGTWQAQEHITTAWQANSIAGTFGDITVMAKSATLKATLDAENKSWAFVLQLPELEVTGTSQPIPTLAVTLTGNASPSRITMKGTAEDREKQYLARFSMNLPTDNPENGILRIEQFRMAWGGGTLSVTEMKIPLSLNKLIRIPLTLERVELAQLLEALGDERIQGTGLVSGTLPILYHPDGKISLEPGAVEALEKGELHVAPELIPGGADENLDTVRIALANFRYDLLKISVLSGKDNRPTIRLEVEGRNVEAFGGRPVKLNVNLTGDVLPLIQQSILPVNDVKQLLKLQEQAP